MAEMGSPGTGPAEEDRIAVRVGTQIVQMAELGPRRVWVRTIFDLAAGSQFAFVAPPATVEELVEVVAKLWPEAAANARRAASGLIVPGLQTPPQGPNGVPWRLGGA